MADMGTGNFEQVSPKMADLLKGKSMSGYLFEVGETVQVKKSQFKVEEIGPQTLTLRLIPDDSFQQVPKLTLQDGHTI